MRLAALVAAAGLGLRLGGDVPKGLRTLAATPLVAHAVRRLAASAAVTQIVVAAPAGRLIEVRDAVAGEVGNVPLTVVAGGVLRQDSVLAMLGVLPAETTHVLVHDAARCLAPVTLIDAVASELAAGVPAVIPVLPVVDTIARVAPDGVVLGTVPRDELRIVQTPQGFERALLHRAHQERPVGWEATDDASVVARLGVPVRTVEGARLAMKVTTVDDLVVATALLTAADQEDPT